MAERRPLQIDQLSRIQLKGKKWELNDTQINFDEGGGVSYSFFWLYFLSPRGFSGLSAATFNGRGHAHCLINLSQSMSRSSIMVKTEA